MPITLNRSLPKRVADLDFPWSFSEARFDRQTPDTCVDGYQDCRRQKRRYSHALIARRLQPRCTLPDRASGIFADTLCGGNTRPTCNRGISPRRYPGRDRGSSHDRYSCLRVMGVLRSFHGAARAIYLREHKDLWGARDGCWGRAVSCRGEAIAQDSEAVSIRAVMFGTMSTVSSSGTTSFGRRPGAESNENGSSPRIGSAGIKARTARSKQRAVAISMGWLAGRYYWSTGAENPR